MDQQKETVPVGDLQVVKDIDKVNIAPSFVLIKITQKKSEIIMPDTVGVNPMSTAYVVKVGNKVDNINVGDVVVDLKNERAGVYYYKKGEDTFMLTDQYNLLMWTTESNYNVS